MQNRNIFDFPRGGRATAYSCLPLRAPMTSPLKHSHSEAPPTTPKTPSAVTTPQPHINHFLTSPQLPHPSPLHIIYLLHYFLVVLFLISTLIFLGGFEATHRNAEQHRGTAFYFGIASMLLAAVDVYLLLLYKRVAEIQDEEFWPMKWNAIRVYDVVESLQDESVMRPAAFL